MRVSKIFQLLLIAIILSLATMPEMTLAKRSGSSRSSSRSSSSYSRSGSRSSGWSWGRSSRSGYSGYYNSNHYTGLVIIPAAGGTYYQGYGNQCPFGCAFSGRCGTQAECASHGRWSVFDWIWTIILICCFCGCAIAGKAKNGSD